MYSLYVYNAINFKELIGLPVLHVDANRVEFWIFILTHNAEFWEAVYNKSIRK